MVNTKYEVATTLCFVNLSTINNGIIKERRKMKMFEKRNPP